MPYTGAQHWCGPGIDGWARMVKEGAENEAMNRKAAGFADYYHSTGTKGPNSSSSSRAQARRMLDKSVALPEPASQTCRH
jgi:hypothetical protein